MKDAQIFVGIDVSKDSLDISVLPEDRWWQVKNNDQDISGLVQSLLEISPQLVVMEATGGHEMRAAAALATAGLNVAVVNPRQVRDFAQATGQLAKTDKIDARMMAHFAQALRPQACPLKDKQLKEIDALVTRRKQLVNMRTAEKNRYKTAGPFRRRDLEEHIEWLTKHIQNMDDEIRKSMRKSPIWRDKDLV